MQLRTVISVFTLVYSAAIGMSQGMTSMENNYSGDCEQLRERFIREASQGGGRALEQYCEDCARGGGPGYRVVQLPGQGVAGKSADEVAAMSCQELYDLEAQLHGITAGIEEAQRIDLQRQLAEQIHGMTGRRDWEREAYKDPESDYWHTQGNDPRVPSFDEQLEDLGTAIKAAFGIGDGGLPKTLPSTGPPPGVKPHPILQALDGISKAISVVGEVGIARARRYHEALQHAEADLSAKENVLTSQVDQLEQIAGHTQGRSGGEVVQRAIRDVRLRKSIVSDRLRAISQSRQRVEKRLRHYYENYPRHMYDI